MKHAMLRVVTAAGLGLTLGWVLAAQEPKKEWKGGQEEYNLFQAYQKADNKGKVEALDKWKAAFPTSDFAEEREEQYLIVYQQLSMNRQAFDKAAEILKTRPNHFYSLSAIERLVFALTPAPTPADLDTAERVSKYILENLDTAFAASNRPADVKEADCDHLQAGHAERRAGYARAGLRAAQGSCQSRGRTDQIPAHGSHTRSHVVVAGRRTAGAE